jgi:hypothetical protein
MKIYIAGKITGDPDYYRKFQDAALKVRMAGHVVITPTCLPDNLGTHDDYMHCCYALIDVSEAVYFLKDWKDSPGATDEFRYAHHTGKHLFFEGDPLPTREGISHVNKIDAVGAF